MEKKKRSISSSSKLAPLPLNQLRHICDLKKFKFKSTEKLPNLGQMIGQDRAVHALTFGLEMKDHGFNIYALGTEGTGKATSILKYLKKEAKNLAVPEDWLYVNNFDNADKPKKLSLPAGKGREFRDDMDHLVTELKTEVPKAFESESYIKERETIEKEFSSRSESLLQHLAKRADEHGFRLIQTAHGFAVLPIVNNKVLSAKEHAELSESKRKELERNQEKLIGEVHEAMHEFDQLQKDGRAHMQELDEKVVSFAVNHLIDALKNKYHKFHDVINFLKEVKDHSLKNTEAFKRIKQIEEVSVSERMMMMSGGEVNFDEYRVNLVVDNNKLEGAPVIYEKNPIGPNLVGRIEQQGVFGALITNFRMIKGGALHQANGGYLMIDMLDLLKKPYAWEMLKRSLKNREIVVESMMETLGIFTTRTLNPEPIPLNLKVILIGNPYLYYLIYEYDEEFKELFKVKADFASFMPRTDEAALQYAQFIGMVCREEKLKHFAPDGVAKVIEYGSRLVDYQNKVTIKFGDIVDLIRQSAYWAAKANTKFVSALSVQKALDEKIYRSNRVEEIIRDMIEEKTIKITTDGLVVGQINGISVLSLGDYSFGKPSRITARTYVGGSGLISIEREIEMGGPIHNKGAMIISGFLGGRFAQDFPMALSVSITFEQVYDHIEGDSASAAEIYVIMSSISKIPLRQDLAITGSVNQIGEIQAIGGVNEKIEGVYRVYKTMGLTGKQGVIIPESNVKNLMLHEEVVAAVKAKKFSIYAISTIDEGIELLTGYPAGKLKSDGTYPKGSVNYIVYNRIRELAEKAKKFGDEKGRRKRGRK